MGTDTSDFVRHAIENLESALVTCGPSSDTTNWAHYRYIASALITVTNVYVELERETVQ